MAKSILGLFKNAEDINATIDDLEKMGFQDDDFSIIAREDIIDKESSIKKNTLDKVGKGASAGGVIGGILGLLAGTGAIALPGLGALLIAGPIAAALGITGVAGATVTGALTGAIAGGLLAGLTEIGVDERKAKMYEEKVKEGQILLGVLYVDNAQLANVKSVMQKNNAEDVSDFNIKEK